jgi:hypothetical protein
MGQGLLNMQAMQRNQQMLANMAQMNALRTADEKRAEKKQRRFDTLLQSMEQTDPGRAAYMGTGVPYPEPATPKLVTTGVPGQPDYRQPAWATPGSGDITPIGPSYKQGPMVKIGGEDKPVPVSELRGLRTPSGEVPAYGSTPSELKAQGTRIVDPEMEKKRNIVGNMESALNRYDKALQKSGTELMPGPEKNRLAGLHKDLVMQLKNAWDMGALQGNEYELLTSALIDPTQASLGNVFRSYSDLKPQLDVLRQKIGDIRKQAGITEWSDDDFEYRTDPKTGRRQKRRR